MYYICHDCSPRPPATAFAEWGTTGRESRKWLLRLSLSGRLPQSQSKFASRGMCQTAIMCRESHKCDGVKHRCVDCHNRDPSAERWLQLHCTLISRYSKYNELRNDFRGKKFKVHEVGYSDESDMLRSDIKGFTELFNLTFTWLFQQIQFFYWYTTVFLFACACISL